MDDLTIACVLWRGDFRGRNYNYGHVSKLMHMAANHLKGDGRLEFICLTNDKTIKKPYKTISLKYPDDLPGWWSKLELFRPNLPIKGKVLYLDLDLFLVDSIDELATFSDGLTFAPPICDRFIHSAPKLATSGKDAGLTTIHRFQSSAISWTAGNHLLDIPNIIGFGIPDFYRGDQDFFGEQFADEGGTFPLEWFDKIKNCFHAKSKPDLKVVLGNPKPMWKRALRGESVWIKRAAQC